MLGLAKRLKINVLQTSTSEVYGDPTVRGDRALAHKQRRRKKLTRLLARADLQGLQPNIRTGLAPKRC